MTVSGTSGTGVGSEQGWVQARVQLLHMGFMVLLLPAALGLGSAARAHPHVVAGKQATPSDADGK